MSILKVFNEQLLEFVDDLLRLFPTDPDLKASRVAVRALKKVNPKALLVNWQYYVTNKYKDEILKETDFAITIEAGSTTNWHKFIEKKGLNFGIEEFGKSAPYKEIYKHFGLTAENISKKTKNLIKN